VDDEDGHWRDRRRTVRAQPASVRERVGSGFFGKLNWSHSGNVKESHIALSVEAMHTYRSMIGNEARAALIE
jgi:hypothetical protein